MPIGIASNALMPPVESRIAAASKDSAPNAGLLETIWLAFTGFAGITLYLVASQIFSGCLTAI